MMACEDRKSAVGSETQSGLPLVRAIAFCGTLADIETFCGQTAILNPWR